MSARQRAEEDPTDPLDAVGDIAAALRLLDGLLELPLLDRRRQQCEQQERDHFRSVRASCRAKT
jgi:hypothetical protein